MFYICETEKYKPINCHSFTNLMNTYRIRHLNGASGVFLLCLISCRGLV